MIAFAGFEMPVRYSGVLEEHLAVRRAAGIFDVSHMGEILVTGGEAEDFVQSVVTNDISGLMDGGALYTVMCNEEGGILDDLLVYRLSPTDYMLVVNASNIRRDLEWLSQHARDRTNIVDMSDQTALIALQGPSSSRILAIATGKSWEDLKSFRFEFASQALFGQDGDIIVSATGYTGERGFELYVPSAAADSVWEQLMSAGAQEGLLPAGLSARDTLRMEAGLALYGNDINEETSPLEAGLGWLVKQKKGAFIGRSAIMNQKQAGPSRRLVGFVMTDRGIPRRGYRILSLSNEPVGSVTSGSQSPVLNAGIGLGYVPNEDRYTAIGSELHIDIRGKSLRATVKKPPLHK